ncbi:hypothetical protein BC941DRAFT_458006 [Chlamydoabsidia padenii]|nr:hypothetical protein BC941DRAFT_458006 [Chlamydoabsidia padenii]
MSIIQSAITLLNRCTTGTVEPFHEVLSTREEPTKFTMPRRDFDAFRKREEQKCNFSLYDKTSGPTRKANVVFLQRLIVATDLERSNRPPALLVLTIRFLVDVKRT